MSTWRDDQARDQVLQMVPYMGVWVWVGSREVHEAMLQRMAQGGVRWPTEDDLRAETWRYRYGR